MSSIPRLTAELAALVWPRASDVAPERMAELHEEINSIISVARDEALRNAFDDQPSDFAAALHRLALVSEKHD